jgi:zinc/manganese transport system substrate-binding protein
MKMVLKHMKCKIFLLALSCLPTGLVSAQQIRAVASWPALADITRQIGKGLVNVESLATGVEDAHGVPMKPSFVPRMNRADVLILIGLDDEQTWIPGLLEVAGNPKILC